MKLYRESLKFNGGCLLKLPGKLIASAHALRSRGSRRKAGGEADMLADDQSVPPSQQVLQSWHTSTLPRCCCVCFLHA